MVLEFLIHQLIECLKKKKKNKPINQVKKIAIDDFAFKKKKFYGTVIIDHETGNYLEFIESRKKEDIVPILKKYSNVELVTRDRASSYGSSIKGALPNADQIADKFHILMNLTEKGEEYIRGLLPSKIYFNENYEICSSKKQVYVLKRSKIETLMYCDDFSNLTEIEIKLIKKIFKQYKDLKYFIFSIKKLKNIFEHKDIRGFHKLMKRWSLSTVKVLKTFTKEIYNDYQAVCNAVRSNYTNAIAEGKINKIKTTKRKCYGRAKPELLFARLFFDDYIHSIE